MLIRREDINNSKIEHLITTELTPLISVVSDKFRAISNLFAWQYNRKWIQKPNAVEDLIEELIKDCLKKIKSKSTDSISTLSGGIMVEATSFDCDFIELSIYLDLL